MNVVFYTHLRGTEGFHHTACGCHDVRRAYRQVPKFAVSRDKVSSDQTVGIVGSILHGIYVAHGPCSRVSELGSRRRRGSSLTAAHVG
jgi:hypothetical protein